ncbi:hypothetical protein KP509_17G043600 [Ceratopteris richardii]|uniref:Chromo domain-containing protein n=1 Tax=Ceratopteris richardii TaxID=49495 RepID=A0A8T2STU1_CERRI|nr:hypothetical protein KP509_17G043600 [Ceratopteris richardii]
MDFITDLPNSDKYDDVLVIVDRFTKMAHFIQTTKTITGAAIIRLFLRYMFRLHGLLDDIVSDRVWLLRNNLQTSRPCAKLDHQRFGPFTILAKINLVNFKLQLPIMMRIHRVFHVSMLEPYQISPLRGERPSPSPPIKIDDHKEFEVEHVLDSRISQGRLEYLIHWKEYAINDHTWEPIENL